MDENNKEGKKAAQKVGGLLFVGCMFLGMAAGWYFGNLRIGLFGGMGLGFIMMAVAVMSEANRK